MRIHKVVGDIMTREVLVLNEDDSLERIADGMDRPVVDGSRLVGLISYRDILRLAVSGHVVETPIGSTIQPHLEENLCVAKVMTRNPLTVRADTPVAEAAAILRRSNFGCVPVVDGDQELIGIVTEHDLLKMLIGILKNSVDGTSKGSKWRGRGLS